MLGIDRMMGAFLGMIQSLTPRNKIEWKSDSNDPTASKGEPCAMSEADIITSKIGESSYHKILIDFDVPVYLTESSTPGHFHLWIDQAVEWEHALEVGRALAKAGVVEVGYVESAADRGFLSLRPPWREKNDKGPRPVIPPVPAAAPQPTEPPF